ncbi:MAG: FAD-dependent oxidoreductase [Acidobacteria bacterium]|nr:FAD-dependent oxidoreductase [Acidobacteriota bacterium]
MTRQASRRLGSSGRSVLKGPVGLPLADAAAAAPANKPHIAVVGAGAFGGWTALHLLRQGARVTLLDAWGPGNSRASSGGETRVIRATYGSDRVCFEMAVRSLQLWRENEVRWGLKLYRRTGVLWMASKNDADERASLGMLRETRLAVEELSSAEIRKRYPQINFEGVAWAIYEKDAGYLLARRACEAVLEGFLKEGGEYRQLSATPGAIKGNEMRGLVLSDGSTLAADHYVFACGPWLGTLFPKLIGDRVKPTRQESFFFGTPAGDPRFLEEQLPVWADKGEQSFYGIPGNERRGFKLADDARGPSFDPTHGDRVPTPEGVKAARQYLEFRFPALKGAPLLEARVCQYENSPDHRFIIDQHPEAGNSWIVGGGSGHGFKHGPAVGERAAELVLGKTRVDSFFALSRLSK